MDAFDLTQGFAPSRCRARSRQPGLGVVGDLAVEIQVGPGLAVLGGELLRPLDGVAEATAGRAQRELGIDLELARDVHRREEQVPGRAERGVAVVAGGLELVDAGPHRVVGDLGQVEPARGRPALDLAGVQRRGEVLGDLAEDPGLAAGLGALDGVPVAQDGPGVVRGDLAEDVRVAAHELLAHVLGDLREVAGVALLHEEREEVDLEEDVAELVEQLGVVALVGRVGELVGLLDGVRDDRALVLLAVPGALHAQSARELVEAPEGVGDVGPAHEIGRLVPPPVNRPEAPTAGASSSPPCAAVVVAFGPFLQPWMV